MDTFKQDEFARQLQLPDNELEEMLVNGEIETVFAFDGEAIAVDHEGNKDPVKVNVSGLFYVASLVPGVALDSSPTVFEELAEIISFTATSDSRILHCPDQSLTIEAFYPGGDMIFRPVQKLSRRLDALVIPEEEVARITTELGLPDIRSQSKGIDPRERQNLFKLVGLLCTMLIDINPKGNFKRPDGSPNIEGLANGILKAANDQEISETGISLRTLRDKIQDALGLLADIKEGRKSG